MEGTARKRTTAAGSRSIIDDSQANNDNLTERLRNFVQDHALRGQAKIAQQSSQEEPIGSSLTAPVKSNDNLIRWLKERAEEMKSRIGN